MPRKADPNTISPAERNRRIRALHGMRTVVVDAEAQQHLAIIRERDGDATNRAAVARLLRVAAKAAKKDR